MSSKHPITSNSTKHSTTIHASQQDVFMGPVPPPQILSGYDNIQKGFAERLIIMAEKETAHRQKMEEKTLEAQIKGIEFEAREARLGQILAFGIGALAILGGIYAGIHGAQTTGTCIGAGGVIGLVSVFIYGRKGKPKSE